MASSATWNDLERQGANDQRVQRQLEALAIADVEAPRSATVLDFGCGAGEGVASLLLRGFDAYGCDLRFKEGPNRDRLQSEERIRLIPTDDYRLPFDDDTFDLVLSDQVFEHVQDYESTLAEIARVTRPGGWGFHVFPSRWRPSEVHVHVPFGGVLRSEAWLRLWARAGRRGPFQKEMTIDEVVAHNTEYLATGVNYLSGRAMFAHFRRHFDDVRGIEHGFLSASRRGRSLAKAPVVGGLAASLYRTFMMRAILLGLRADDV